MNKQAYDLGARAALEDAGILAKIGGIFSPKTIPGRMGLGAGIGALSGGSLGALTGGLSANEGYGAHDALAGGGIGALIGAGMGAGVGGLPAIAGRAERAAANTSRAIKRTPAPIKLPKIVKQKPALEVNKFRELAKNDPKIQALHQEIQGMIQRGVKPEALTRIEKAMQANPEFSRLNKIVTRGVDKGRTLTSRERIAAARKHLSMIVNAARKAGG
jgi:hypothetical protein